MKKLFVESVLPVDPATAWSIFESQEFRDRLAAETGISSEVLHETEDGGVEVKRLKFVSASELPTVAAKALGTRHLAYEQQNRLDHNTSSLDWEVFLPVLSDRVTVKGVTSIQPHPDGCRRVVDGTIEVRMRLIGGQIEKAVVGEFEKSMSRAVDLVRAMIAERTDA